MIDVVVIGAGQAGLATSYWLSERGVGHVLLERDRPGHSWTQRWDSFCLVTPNWTLDLPGFPYDGDDPDGFILRDEIVDCVRRYREFLAAPVEESTEVLRLSREDDTWRVHTNNGDWVARSVVVATGAFPFPSTPTVATSIGVLQLHSSDYRRVSDLPEGGVLVVGSGQSGAQIVDDLIIAGRDVWFSVGQAGEGPRRYRGKDITAWLKEIGFMDQAMTEEMRQGSSIIVSGRDGGKDLNLRTFGRDGVHLVGRVTGAGGQVLALDDNVGQTLDAADEVSARLRGAIDRYIDEHGIEAPPSDFTPIDWSPAETPRRLDLESVGISAIIWATGYRYDFSWIDVDIFDARGYPNHRRGVTSEPGLYFIGLLGLNTPASSLFSGVGDDARHVVDHLVDTRVAV